MALRGLVDGDCGGQNPLTKLRGFYTQDQGRVEERLRHTPQHQQLGEAGQLTEGELVTDFIHNQVGRRPPSTFRMDSLLHELRQTELPSETAPVLNQGNSGWAREFSQSNQGTVTWSDEYMKHEGKHKTRNMDSRPLVMDSRPRVMDTRPLVMDNGPRAFTMDNRMLLRNSTPLHPGYQMGPGEQHSWAVDYLAEVPVLEGLPLDHHNIDPVEYRTFVESIENAKSRDELAQEESGRWADEFISQAHSQMKEKVTPASETYKQDFWKSLESEWDSLGIGEEDSHPWLQDFNTDYEPFKEYQFQESNPTVDVSNPLEEGKRRLKEGDIPSAVLLFEAAVQKSPDSVEGWLLLGKTQAENEQDNQSISALKKCLSLDGSNQTALMSLAASLTNESYEAQACQALHMWLQNNPEYQQLVGDDRVQSISFSSAFMSEDIHNKTTDLFIQAALSRQGSDLDPDVQAGLGVLFNLSNDYTKAADCFRAALGARPKDSLLWNRLGATLANGSESEKAVDAYRTALWHSPGFLRCRYNLGISCINLKAYKEAAEHFLTALNFQATGRGPQGSRAGMSDSIWSSLRLAVSLLNRPDLKGLVDGKDLDALSREFNITVTG